MIAGFLLWFSASIGFQTYGELMPNYEYVHPPIFAEMELHAEGDIFDIYTKYTNEMEINNLTSYTPMNDYFIVGLRVKRGSFSMNYEHMCQHPVGNWSNPLIGEYGGYNKVWISVSSKDL